jgi:hypothetical protein
VSYGYEDGVKYIFTMSLLMIDILYCWLQSMRYQLRQV